MRIRQSYIYLMYFGYLQHPASLAGKPRGDKPGWCPMMRGNLDAETDTQPGKTEGRRTATYEPRIAEAPPKLRGRPCPHSLGRNHPADTPISEFWPPELGDTKRLPCKPLGLQCCVTHPRRQIQIPGLPISSVGCPAPAQRPVLIWQMRLF